MQFCDILNTNHRKPRIGKRHRCFIRDAYPHIQSCIEGNLRVILKGDVSD